MKVSRTVYIYNDDPNNKNNYHNTSATLTSCIKRIDADILCHKKENKNVNVAALEAQRKKFKKLLEVAGKLYPIHNEKDCLKRLNQFILIIKKHLKKYDESIDCWTAVTRQSSLVTLRTKLLNLESMTNKRDPKVKFDEIAELLVQQLDLTEEQHHKSFFKGYFGVSKLAQTIMDVFVEAGVDPAHYNQPKKIDDPTFQYANFAGIINKHLNNYERNSSCWTAISRRSTLVEIRTTLHQLNNRKSLLDLKPEEAAKIKMDEMAKLLIQQLKVTESHHQKGFFKGFFGESQLAKTIRAIFAEMGIDPNHYNNPIAVDNTKDKIQTQPGLTQKVSPVEYKSELKTPAIS